MKEAASILHINQAASAESIRVFILCPEGGAGGPDPRGEGARAGFSQGIPRHAGREGHEASRGAVGAAKIGGRGTCTCSETNVLCFPYHHFFGTQDVKDEQFDELNRLFTDMTNDLNEVRLPSPRSSSVVFFSTECSLQLGSGIATCLKDTSSSFKTSKKLAKVLNKVKDLYHVVRSSDPLSALAPVLRCRRRVQSRVARRESNDH